MEVKTITICLLLLIYCSSISADRDSSATETFLDSLRLPRVSGRIVKLYSGARPEPIQCPQEGFQLDPVDCTVFYRCVKGANNKFTVFRFQCGPGTVYDPDTEVCNFPRNTRRSECGGMAPSKDKNKENEITSGIQSELPSPINMKPDHADTSVNKQTTTYPWATPQSHNHPQTSPSDFSGYPSLTDNQGLPSKDKDSTQPKPSRQEGDICTTDGFMGDSENCRKFYRCVGNQRGGFMRYEFTCSETTVWDQDAQSCNHPWAVQRSKCGTGNFNNNKVPDNALEQSSNNQNPNTIQQQLQINYGDKVSQTQTQISYGQVIQNQTQINYGDRESKNENAQAKQNQTQISYGSAVSQAQTQINHGNNVVQTQLQVDHNKDASQSQTQIHETTSKTSTSTATQDDLDQGYGEPVKEPESSSVNNEGNKNECTESGFMGDKNDCKKFYRCVDNGRGGFIKYEFSCGDGTVWDSSIEACNHAWAVKECGGKAPSSSSPQNVPQTTSEPTQTTQSQVTTPEENEDVGYGNQNQEQEQEKPVTTTTTQKSNQPVTTTQPSSTEETSCTTSGFVGDSNDCKTFYRCVDNGRGTYTKYEYKCGEGTVWDPDIEACNHAWAVKKCGGIATDINKVESTTNSVITTVSLIQTTTQNSQELDDSGYGQQPVEQSTTTSRPTMQPESNKPKEDNQCTGSGFMGDSNDCKKFYRCVDNGNEKYIRYEFSCGEGTVWDPEIEACNHAWAVKKCGGSQSGDIPKETTTSGSPSISEETSITSTDDKETDKPTQTSTTIEQQQSTSKPSPEKGCSQEGFMGDDSDCKKFYRCVDNGHNGFIKYEFSCGEGTVWDSEINSCNHASSNRQCQGTANQIITGSQQSDEMSTEKENVATSSSTEQSKTTTTSDKPQTTNDQCVSEGFLGDSYDCKKFYRCVDNGKGGYTKYEFTCGEGTIWDQEIQGCNHGNSANCSKVGGGDSQSSKPQPEPTDDGTTTSSTQGDSTHTQGTEAPVHETSNTCSAEGFYANPNDCKKFFRCVDNGKGGYTKYDFSCGDGTVWVQEIQACDHDTGDTCSSQNKPPPSSTETTTSKSSTTSTAPNYSSTQESNKENDENHNESSGPPVSDSNEEKCTSEGFYANKKDCRKFYRCVDNGNGGYTKYDFDCGEGTAWDSDIQSCNHINEVKTCENQSQTSQNDETTQSSGTMTESTSTTSTSGPASESSKPASDDKCQNEGYYGNSKDCKKFYRCVDNGKGGYTKYDFDCGEGTIWDQDITACNHPQDVSNLSCQQSDNSGTSSSSSSSDGSSTSASSSSDSSSTESSTSGSSDCSQGTTKKPENKKVNCTEAGYYPDPDDCKKFYRCVDWDGDGKKFSVFHFNCGEGTIWDPALDTCNYEDSVYPPRDCSGSQSQNENVQESSTTEGTSGTDEPTTEESATQESTTNQQSTTEEVTTSEQTTTEQTTTEQSTTHEQTTTDQTTTTDKSTTEQTTTEKTTTQESTTQQSTSSEQTTTQQTTEQTTTEEKEETTEGTTTQESTTQQTTEHTDESETSESSTTESTTESQQHSTTENEQESTTESQQSSTTEDEHESTTESGQESTTKTEQEATTEDGQESTTEGGQESTTEGEQESTTEGEQESTTEGGNQTTESSSSSSSECPETDEDQNVFVCPTSFRRHPQYCNMFYQCTEDDDTHDVQIATFRCPNNTIYDEKKVQCVEESKTDEKCKGEIAQKRRIKRYDTTYKEPLVITKERLKCPAAGHYPFEKDECSPAFLKCQKNKSGKLRGYVYQCPQGYLYWSVSRRCEKKSYLRDCKHSANNNWTSRWEIPIERRNVAP